MRIKKKECQLNHLSEHLGHVASPSQDGTNMPGSDLGRCVKLTVDYGRKKKNVLLRVALHCTFYFSDTIKYLYS